MDIIIAGAHGSGKSDMGDLIKNIIFKMDEEAKINNHDPDRTINTFGNGKREYNISTKTIEKEEELSKEGDIVILINNDRFQKWFEEVYI